MKEATIKKHIETATYSQAEVQPDEHSRWDVLIERRNGNVSLSVVAEDRETAQQEADKAYRDYLRVTGAID